MKANGVYLVPPAPCEEPMVTSTSEPRQAREVVGAVVTVDVELVTGATAVAVVDAPPLGALLVELACEWSADPPDVQLLSSTIAKPANP